MDNTSILLKAAEDERTILLPINSGRVTLIQLKRLGFILDYDNILGKNDDLWESSDPVWSAVLPEGWTINEWNRGQFEIFDEKNRKRLSYRFEQPGIFDASLPPLPTARLHFLRKFFTIEEEYDYVESADENISICVWHIYVEDANKRRLADGTCREITNHDLIPILNTSYDPISPTRLYAKMEEYLDANYPDWRDPLAYWD